MSEPAQAIKIGCCTGCDAPIFERDGKQMRPLDIYREHEMELSNGTLMPVGVCAGCKTILDANTNEAKALADHILERHRVLWNVLPAGEQFKPPFHHGLTIVDHRSSKDKMISKMLIREKASEAQRQDQAEKADQIHDERVALEAEEKKNENE